jgi:hypothetical protein
MKKLLIVTKPSWFLISHTFLDITLPALSVDCPWIALEFVMCFLPRMMAVKSRESSS